MYARVGDASAEKGFTFRAVMGLSCSHRDATGGITAR
jgi:hypothetical protein